MEHARCDAAVAELLDTLGYPEASEVVKARSRGIMTLPRSMADTRDGREEAIGMLREAFQSERPPVLVIT